jgi:hypothetical protein
MTEQKLFIYAWSSYFFRDMGEITFNVSSIKCK